MAIQRNLAVMRGFMRGLGLIGLSALSTASFGQAGEAPPDSATEAMSLEEITVTAQKIEQKLIDVPISMTVLGTDELEGRRVQDLKDYVFSLPNVTFEQRGREEGVDIIFRGVRHQGGHFTTVTSTVDGIPYNLSYNNILLELRSFDTESIEVLRGPQGTLSGALALGGIINLVTVKPSTVATSGDLTVDYGRFDTRLVKGSYNLPLGEKLALRASTFLEKSDGAVENRGPAGGSSSTDHAGGRLALRWTPTDALTIDVAGTYDKQDYGLNNRLYIDQHEDGPNDTSVEREETIAFFDRLGGQFKDPRIPFWGEGADSDGGYLLEDFPERDELRTRLYSLHVNYDAGAHHVDLLYGHYGHERVGLYDGDRTQYGYYSGTSGMDISTHSAELRFSSKYDGALNWVAGLAWQKESFGADEVGYVSDLGLAINDGQTEGLPGLSETLDRLDYVFREGGLIDAKAVFANAFYDFAERWHLSVGARLTRFNVGVFADCCAEDEFGSLLAGRGRSELLALIPDRSRDTTATASDFSPRIALNFDVMANVSAYFQFGTGFRPGGGNDVRAVNAGLADDVAKSEFVKNFELGIKGAFFDNRLSLATAVFYMDYTDLQVWRFVDLQPIEIEYVVNAGSAEMMGVEIESTLKVAKGFEIRAGVGYTDSKIKELELDGEPTVFDEDVPGIRPWTATLSAIYERPVTGRLTAGLRADYDWQERPTADPRSFAWETLDLSATLSGANWAASAYFENVLDESTRTGLTYDGIVPTVFFVPRTYGVRFVYHFGGVR